MERKSLVLPIAGESSRYGSMPPKWVLEHPSGNMMVTESIRGLPMDSFDKVLVIGLEKHDKHSRFRRLEEEISDNYDINRSDIDVVKLAAKTDNQPETVYYGLKESNITEGAILIKDCDGYYRYNDDVDWSKNHVAVGNLHTVGVMNAGNKSYVRVGENNTVGNIIEKRVISHLFCCGGYYFARADEFISYFHELKDKKDLYVSHIIYQMLLDNHVFFIEEGEDFKDWGTKEDWVRYIHNLGCNKVISVDVDNTLCVTDSDVPYSQREPIRPVIQKLREYKKKGFIIKIHTSRQMQTYHGNIGQINKNTLPTLISWLDKYDVPYDEIFVGKPWSGKSGFAVDDKTIRPGEFLDLSYDEIMDKLDEGRVQYEYL